MHAKRILRSHGMVNTQLQLVYRSVVIAKLTYASSSWWGFTTNKPSITQLIEEADDNLFDKIKYNLSHPLHHLLPKKTDHSYSLRSRSHNFELTVV